MFNRSILDIPKITRLPTSASNSTTTWKYWTLCRISPGSERVGYEYRLIPQAKEFFQKATFLNPHHQNPNTQAALFNYFQTQNQTVDATNRAMAGLCLRCNVSYPIFKACQKIDSLFGHEKSFTYKDLLSLVLNDDGKTLILLDKDGKTQLVLDEFEHTQPSTYKFFSVEVLRTFKPDSSTSMSLENWAYLQTKQNPEIKNLLSEFGLKHLSDWALLNRVKSKQLECLSARDRTVVEVFHAVYRRDRRNNRQPGAKKCPDPSNMQLQEMLSYLRDRDIAINTNIELMKELKQIVMQLRQYDIWSYREPLEIRAPDTGVDVPRADLPYHDLNAVDLEQQEFIGFLHQQLKSTLKEAIQQEIRASISQLQTSKKYAPFAQKFLTGLQLYYGQGLSLKEIAPSLGMTSWDQARRILNPGELLNKIRASTVGNFLAKTLSKAHKMGLTKTLPEPEYLKTLAVQTEAFADAEIFQAAQAEIKCGKHRQMNSLYAQQIRVYLEQHT